MSVALALPLAKDALPEAVEVDDCNIDLHFKINFGKSISGDILNLIEPLIAAGLRSQVSKQGCAALFTFAKANFANCYIAMGSPRKIHTPNHMQSIQTKITGTMTTSEIHMKII